MRRAIFFCLTIVLVFSLSACKAKEALDKVSIAKDLKERGTTDLMKQISEDAYEPPADGRLTDAQIQMYLKVREHEKQIAKVARQELEQHAAKTKESGEASIAGVVSGFKAMGSVADFFTADLRAASDLGYNTAEYSWVKGQVLAASGSVMTEKFVQGMGKMMDDAYARTKKQHDEATDPATKKIYAEMLAGYEKTKAETAEQEIDPAVAYNRSLLEKYEATLTALTAELSKYEETEGDAEKAVTKWAEELEKSAPPENASGNE